jgi:hypothetical protein
MMEGVLLRGAIATGDICMRSGQVFGPALGEAHDLESQFARYPRIVVSPNLLQAIDSDSRLRAHHHSLEEEKKFIRTLIRRGDDGIWFIDYLRAIESEMEDPAMYMNFLQAHRDCILSGAADLIRSDDAMDKNVNNAIIKYSWLSHYHNEVVRDLRGRYKVRREELQISNADLHVFYNM